jgi:thiaminase (transcriptional activator TenA)
MAFADDLRQAADPIWAAQHEHPFVRGIGEGSLDPSKFRHYVRQDYLFLIDYARMLALGCARALRADEMARFAQLAAAVLGGEIELHRSYAADWGITETEPFQRRLDQCASRLMPSARQPPDHRTRVAAIR